MPPILFDPFRFFRDLKRKDHKPAFGALDIFKYIGPGLLVTVGFTDPGNWAANIATGSEYGYSLLWIVTLSTLMLIVLQHNVAHLGIATGFCLSIYRCHPGISYILKESDGQICQQCFFKSTFTDNCSICNLS